MTTCALAMQALRVENGRGGGGKYTRSSVVVGAISVRHLDTGLQFTNLVRDH